MKLMLKYEKEGFYIGFFKKKVKFLFVVDYGMMYSLCWVL